MSAYLEAVAQARDQREQSEAAFRAALARAAEHHSLRQIAPYAGMTFTGVHHLLQAQKESTDA